MPETDISKLRGEMASILDKAGGAPPVIAADTGSGGEPEGPPPPIGGLLESEPTGQEPVKPAESGQDDLKAKLERYENLFKKNEIPEGEMENALMRWKDYTQKTQELARDREQLLQERMTQQEILNNPVALKAYLQQQGWTADLLGLKPEEKDPGPMKIELPEELEDQPAAKLLVDALNKAYSKMHNIERENNEIRSQLNNVVQDTSLTNFNRQFDLAKEQYGLPDDAKAILNLMMLGKETLSTTNPAWGKVTMAQMANTLSKMMPKGGGNGNSNMSLDALKKDHPEILKAVIDDYNVQLQKEKDRKEHRVATVGTGGKQPAPENDKKEKLVTPNKLHEKIANASLSIFSKFGGS